MNFLGLNSPAIFVLSVIVLIILGPKRVEKGWLLTQRLLKFLLSNNKDISKDKSNLGSQLDLKSEAIEVKDKEEVAEAKSEEPEAIEVKDKEEVADVKSKRKKTKQNKTSKEWLLKISNTKVIYTDFWIPENWRLLGLFG